MTGNRISETVPEFGACVSAPSEVRKGEHGVLDPDFAFRSSGSLGAKLLTG
ncbi:MAG: hypothetical protein WCK75_05545 [Elusimicrobiota bacterium]